MNALRLQTKALPVVRIGIVGLGERGLQAVKRLNHVKGVCLSALCDLHIHTDNIRSTIDNWLKQHPNLSPSPRMFTDYHHVCNDDNVDLVYAFHAEVSHFLYYFAENARFPAK